MALKERIQNDLKAALLGGNRFEAEVLRNLKAAILNEEVAKNRRDDGLHDDEIEKIIAREVKKRHESISLFEQNGRDDLADNEKKEVAVLVTYLPEQLNETQVRELVRAVMSGVDITAPSAMGQVIGAVKAQAGSTADGAMIAKIVKQELAH